MDMEQSLKLAFEEERYLDCIHICEDSIESTPDRLSSYWYCGTALLLLEREAEAQAAWMLGISQIDEIDQDTQLNQLVSILQYGANCQENAEQLSTAWSLRQYVREFRPTSLQNLLKLLRLSIKLGLNESCQELVEETITLIQDEQHTHNLRNIESLRTLAEIVDCQPDSIAVESIVETWGKNLEAEQYSQLIDSLMPTVIKIGHFDYNYGLAIKITEILLKLCPRDHKVLLNMISFYRKETLYKKAIFAAREYYSSCKSLEEKIFGGYLLLRTLKESGSNWSHIDSFSSEYSVALDKFIADSSKRSQNPHLTWLLLNAPSLLMYISDTPQRTREYQNRISDFCCRSIFPEEKRFHKSSNPPGVNNQRKVRVGYLSHCFNNHSVGWLSRWLIQHHDRERFEINAYYITQREHDSFSEQFFIPHTSNFYHVGVNPQQIAQKIYDDKVDILVDLDSLTLDVSCSVMSLKPSPIQVSWLGFDASALPTIDYFIADPYVLPDDAKDYYREKIWRLPEVYLSVGGFEVGVPTLKRRHLNIPDDAIVYLTIQNSIKLNRRVIEQQLKILPQVPNSYLLVKGLGDQVSVRNLFYSIAKEYNISKDRLRFLNRDASELIHRANLAIADIVLDTYPYNGATTTLETLWMGIPIVTQVGEQFAARNTYTMLVNTGVAVGITWSDQEYTETGIRLGLDPNLRQKVSQQMYDSRQNSPLWNPRKFTQEIEKAYIKMLNI